MLLIQPRQTHGCGPKSRHWRSQRVASTYVSGNQRNVMIVNTKATAEGEEGGEDPFRVVDGLSQAVDGILRQLYLQIMGDAQDRVEPSRRPVSHGHGLFHVRRNQGARRTQRVVDRRVRVA